MRKKCAVAVLVICAAGMVLAINFQTGPSVSIKSDFVSRPTFSKHGPVAMDGGKVLYIGRSANWDDQYAYFHDIAANRRITHKIPLKEYFTAHTSLLINGELVRVWPRRTEPSYHMEAVRFYDRTRGLAGLEVWNTPKGRENQRRFFMFLDIKANRIVKTVLLSEAKPYNYYTFPAGYDMASGTFYFVQGEPAGAPDIRMDGGGNGDTGKNGDTGGDGDTGNDGDTGKDGDTGRDGDGDGNSGGGDSDGPQENGDSLLDLSDKGIVPAGFLDDKRKNVSVYALTMNSIKRVARFISDNKFNYSAFDEPGKRLFVPEYTEGAGSNGHGYLVDLVSGTVRKMAIPTTPYGIAFDEGKIHIASSDSGQIWTLEAATGRKLGQVLCWTHGHALGFVKPNVLVWVRNQSLVFFRTPGPVRTEIVPTTRFYTGFCHVGGSLVLPGMIILVNGDEFKVIRF